MHIQNSDHPITWPASSCLCWVL